MKNMLLFLFAFLCVASPTQAATYSVAKTGKDTNPGTATAPWLTIQKAANVMAPGDTVLVSAGTYAERVLVSRSGTAGFPVTFQAQGLVAMKGFRILANYIHVDGFDISFTTPGWSSGPGVYVKGKTVEVSNNAMHDLPFYGIFYDAVPEDSPDTSDGYIHGNVIIRAVEAGMRIMGTNHLIEANDISHSREFQPGVTKYVSGDDADGIRFFGNGHVFRHNYIHDIYSTDPGNLTRPASKAPHIDALQTWGPAYNILFEANYFSIPEDGMQGSMISLQYAPVRDLTFINNIFVNGSAGYGPGLNFYSGSGHIMNVLIANNDFIRPNGVGTYCIRLQPGIQTVTVQNNIAYNCGRSGYPYIAVEQPVPSIVIGYNDVYRTDGIPPPGSPYPNDLWMVDPNFVGMTDYHLQLNSPLIDAGIAVSGVSVDYDSVPRPQGAAYDIGAFEFFQ